MIRRPPRSPLFPYPPLFRSTVTAELVPAPWVKVNYTLGADYSNDERLEGAPQSSTPPQVGGRVTEGKLINYQIDHNLTATASYTLSPRFGGTLAPRPKLKTPKVPPLANGGPTLLSPPPYQLS